jgi:GTPase Era involved in 16S rRNA processing
MDDEFLIVVLGACNTGKSFLINAVTCESKCTVSNDGQPTTLEPVLIQSKQMIFIDTPGLRKSPTKMPTLKFPDEFQPSLIWLVINFQASIENDEFDILDAIPNAPVLVVLNKVSACTKEELENFDKENFVTRHKKLASVHRRLMEEKKRRPNICHIISISFRDEDDTDSQPISVGCLREITNEYMEKHKADAQSG